MSRYKHSGINNDDDGNKFVKSTIYPVIPPSSNDLYVISKAGDRLDILANRFYNDISKWWIIAVSNNLGKGSMQIESGIRLRIPMDTSAFIAKLEANQKG